LQQPQFARVLQSQLRQLLRTHRHSEHAAHVVRKAAAHLLMTMPSAAARMPLKLSSAWRVSTLASMRVLVMPRESKNSLASRTSSLQEIQQQQQQQQQQRKGGRSCF
jgi:hypothetical protein